MIQLVCFRKYELSRHKTNIDLYSKMRMSCFTQSNKKKDIVEMCSSRYGQPRRDESLEFSILAEDIQII